MVPSHAQTGPGWVRCEQQDDQEDGDDGHGACTTFYKEPGYGHGRALDGFLVNIALATLTAPDTVTVGDTQLPVSRKYREAVQQLPMLA